MAGNLGVLDVGLAHSRKRARTLFSGMCPLVAFELPPEIRQVLGLVCTSGLVEAGQSSWWWAERDTFGSHCGGDHPRNLVKEQEMCRRNRKLPSVWSSVGNIIAIISIGTFLVMLW